MEDGRKGQKEEEKEGAEELSEAGEGKRLADRAETFREDEGIKSESDRRSVLERGMIEGRTAGFWW